MKIYNSLKNKIIIAAAFLIFILSVLCAFGSVSVKETRASEEYGYFDFYTIDFYSIHDLGEEYRGGTYYFKLIIYEKIFSLGEDVRIKVFRQMEGGQVYQNENRGESDGAFLKEDFIFDELGIGKNNSNEGTGGFVNNSEPTKKLKIWAEIYVDGNLHGTIEKEYTTLELWRRYEKANRLSPMHALFLKTYESGLYGKEKAALWEYVEKNENNECILNIEDLSLMNNMMFDKYDINISLLDDLNKGPGFTVSANEIDYVYPYGDVADVIQQNIVGTPEFLMFTDFNNIVNYLTETGKSVTHVKITYKGLESSTPLGYYTFPEESEYVKLLIARIAELEEQIKNTSNMTYEELDARMQQINELIEAANANISGYVERIAELEASVNQKTNEINDLNEKIAQNETLISNLRTEKNELLSEKESLENQITTLKQELADEQSDNAALTSRISELETQLSVTETNLQKIEQDYNTLSSSYTELQNEKNEILGQYDELNKNLNTLKTEYEAVKAALDGDVKSLTDLLNSYRQQNAALEKNNTELKEENANLKEELEQLKNKNNGAGASCSSNLNGSGLIFLLLLLPAVYIIRGRRYGKK